MSEEKTKSRLTEKTENGYQAVSDMQSIIERLGYYEDMDEQDRLIKLPVPPKTEIYLLDLNCGLVAKPEDCDYDCLNCLHKKYDVMPYMPSDKYQTALMTRGRGYDCFLTREEAERKIEEIRRQDEEKQNSCPTDG